nr:hypothetical protein GCM10017745_41240 [Saccharothrix mutabilis subsp. capreolus]
MAERAVSGLRSSFRAALVLERYLRENYELVTSGPLPVGHGWPALERFLLHEKRGTSEQFAAAYVALARLRGIPARLVVGFSSPADGTVVRNGDAVAWPEVAVEGVGWVALDPTGAVRATADSGVAQDTERAREELPPAGGSCPSRRRPTRCGPRTGCRGCRGFSAWCWSAGWRRCRGSGRCGRGGVGGRGPWRRRVPRRGTGCGATGSR